MITLLFFNNFCTVQTTVKCIRAATSENVSSGMCAQPRFRNRLFTGRILNEKFLQADNRRKTLIITAGMCRLI